VSFVLCAASTPLIVKLEGTQGKGVVLAETKKRRKVLSMLSKA
jgi:glutathione synthase/RimK-type ligase-like ATP-grasp enzyme